MLVESHCWGLSFQCLSLLPHVILLGSCVVILDSDFGREIAGGLLCPADCFAWLSLIPVIRVEVFLTGGVPPVNDQQKGSPLREGKGKWSSRQETWGDTPSSPWGYFFVSDSWKSSVWSSVLWLQFHCSLWPSVEASRHIQPCGWVVSAEGGLGVGAPRWRGSALVATSYSRWPEQSRWKPLTIPWLPSFVYPDVASAVKLSLIVLFKVILTPLLTFTLDPPSLPYSFCIHATLYYNT